MAEVSEASTSPAELLAEGRRHLAVKDFSAAVETLAKACEVLAEEFGEMGDQCGEAYLWYGKALLGLSREESGVLGDGVPGTGNSDEEEDENDEQEENGENEALEQESKKNGESSSGTEKTEAESTTEEPGSSSAGGDEPGTSNGDVADESMVDADADDVDNLQLAWIMLDLSRNILLRRVSNAASAARETARALLADTHLALGEVALESETYDTAVIDLQSCLEIQKDLYGSDDRRIAETHYQIGLANSLAANFEEAITHFKNAANILESRIKTLENPAAQEDATVKKYSTNDPGYSIEGEIKELKELLPEIQEKIQDMMDYKAESSPLSEYLFLPWLGVCLRGLCLRQGPTVAALIYTMFIVNGAIDPLFITAFSFLFLLEARLWLEIARVVRSRWETRHHIIAQEPPYEVETLWSNDDIQSVEVQNYVY